MNMNIINKEKYAKYILEAAEENVKPPYQEAYAAAKLIKDSLLDRSYKVLYKDTDIQTFDVVVDIPVDPVFGIYFEDDGDGESVMAISTEDGIVIKYV